MNTLKYIAITAMIILTSCSTKYYTGEIYIHDADTIYLDYQPLRFKNIDCPELNTPQGIKAKEKLEELIEQHKDSIQIQIVGKDKYNRDLGTVYIGKYKVRSISEILIQRGYCKEWIYLLN